MDAYDVQILTEILGLCDEIESSIQRYGDTLDNFLLDKDYRKSVFLSILSIGELSKELSVPFKKNTGERIPWRRIVGYRNHIAHVQRDLDYEDVFYTAKNDVPQIKLFCEDWVLP
jgi:uncharacterized protein with HEPN domain